VELRIRDQGGHTLVDTLTDDPWFYADLQPGTYTIEASHSDQSLTKIARVSDAKQTQIIFTW
jgi:hypothetical protein